MNPSLLRMTVLTGLLAGGLACTPPTGGTKQSGTLAVSDDGKHLYVADADNNQVLVIDPDRKSVTRKIPVGKVPTRVVVGTDGRLFVSNSQERSVSVVDPNQGKETKRIAVGTEPTGLALSADGKTLLVANTTSNSVSVIDVPSLSVQKTIRTDQSDPRGTDPAGITFLPDGRVYVTHLRSGVVSILEKETYTPTGAFALNVPLPTAITSLPRTPEQPTTPVVDLSGRVFIPHSQATVSLIPTAVDDQNTSTGGGSAYAGGGDGFTVTSPVVAPAVATVDTSTNGIVPSTDTSSQAPKAGAAIVPPTVLTVQNQSLSGPSAAVIDPSGQYLYVTHLNSNNLAVLPLRASPPASGNGAVVPAPFSLTNVGQIISVGAGPNGIAIPPSGDRLYVYNSFDHSISVIKASGSDLHPAEVYKVGETSLTPEQDLGRRLFFSASDSRMTSISAGGIACASCHPNGRDDGRTWQFSEGPRNTPLLAGRHLRETPPYHWDGALSTMHDFNRVITTRMGGVGDGSNTQESSTGDVLTDSDFNAMLAFLDGQPTPDNPFRDQADPAAVDRGRAIFTGKAGCAGCHDQTRQFTDNGFHDVGTVGPTELFPQNGMVNTPTLHNLFASAPYLHDGSKATLRDRVNDDANGLHGTTSNLTDDEKNDLVTYLQTL